MMIGFPSVNSFPFLYRILTLLLLLLFAGYDYKHHKVRNAALLAFLPWCLVSLPLSLAYSPWIPVAWFLLYAVSGFLSGGLLLFFVSMLSHGGIGGGDIKLSALLGILLGSCHVLLAVFLAALLALLTVSINKLLFHKKIDRIAFVPYLFLGTAAVLLLC